MPMTTAKASSIVFGSAIITVGTGWFYYARKGEAIPPHRFIIGSALTFLAITFVSDINAELAAAMGTAVATTAFFHYGTSLINYINQSPTKPTTKHQTQPQKPHPQPRHVGTAQRGFTG